MKKKLLACIAVSITLASASVAYAGTDPVIQDFTATLTDQNKITLSWKVSNPPSSNLAYILNRGTSDYSPFFPDSSGDVGYVSINCQSTQPAHCTATTYVSTSGIKRFAFIITTLDTTSVTEALNHSISATTQVYVPPLAPPKLTNPVPPKKRVLVYSHNMQDVQSQKIGWSHLGPGYVRISKGPFSYVTNPATNTTKFSATGTYKDIDFPHRDGDVVLGDYTYDLKYCEQPGQSPIEFCSPSVPVTFSVGPARFDGKGREFVNTGAPLTVSWSGDWPDIGSFWHLKVPSLNINAPWVTQPSYTFQQGVLTEGFHSISLLSCKWGTGCSDMVHVHASATGTITFTDLPQDPQGEDLAVKGRTVAVIHPDSGGEDVKVIAPITGRFNPQVSGGSHVQENDSVADISGITPTERAYKQIIVGQTMPDWSIKLDWDQDYDKVATHIVSDYPSLGNPITATFDNAGNIWLASEFATAIGEIKKGGDLIPHIVPLKHYLGANNQSMRVKPFYINGKSYSAHSESIISVGQSIWFPQTGGLLGSSNGVGNYSRIVRFDQTAVDDPTTFQDDRFCAIHVPGNDSTVEGVTWDSENHRLWFSEIRYGKDRAAIAWLDPDDFSGSCNNLLNYNNENAINAANNENLCSPSNQQACIHVIEIPPVGNDLTNVSPEQLQYDSQGYIWFTTEGYGQYLGRYTIATGQFDFFPMPVTPQIDFFGGVTNGYPWDIKVTGNAVYISMFSDDSIMRFDKAASDSSCKNLVDGKNPCMSAIYLPSVISKSTTYFMALQNNKLWFVTGALNPNSRQNANMFGYVNVNTWSSGTPQATIYTGLSSLTGEKENTLSGIAVSQQGDIAMIISYRNGESKVVRLSLK